MKKSHILFLSGLCAAGTLTGYGLHRVSSGRAESSPANAADNGATAGRASESGQPTADGHAESGEKPSVADIPQLRSEGTLESILALDPGTNYTRIALWLATADESQLAAYWAGYKGGKRSVQVTDLVFINWTRRNPQQAVAAVADTGDARYAWWSWASNDPAAALASGKQAGREAMIQVACGIGDFNPQWLRKHLEEIPEEFRGEAFGRMRNWPTGLEPLATLDFMKLHGVAFDERVFANLAKEDPWSALDWMKENPEQNRHMFGDRERLTDLLISTLIRENPEDLEKLAAGLPESGVRRKMEQALFDHLLETDPAKAMEQAKATKAPLIMAQRLGQIGLGLVGSDREKAFGIADDMLAANPPSFTVSRMVEYPEGGMSYQDNTKASELFSALYTKDRERVMGMLASRMETTGGSSGEVLSDLSRKWLDEDPEGFSKWAGQTKGKTLESAASQISFHLAQRGHFEDAIGWAKAGGGDPGDAYYGLLHYWGQSDPAAANAWLDSSSLTEVQKTNYRKIINRNQP